MSVTEKLAHMYTLDKLPTSQAHSLTDRILVSNNILRRLNYFSFDAIHENKRTRDGISLLPARFLRSVLAVAFQMADSEMHFAEL